VFLQKHKYTSASSDKDSKLCNKVNFVIKYRSKFKAVYKLQMSVTK